MLNEEKIKIMNKLAMYEQGEGKKYLPVSRYYRSDYIGLAMIKNFFLVTIGYCLILAGIAAYFAEYLIDNVHKMNLVSLLQRFTNSLAPHVKRVLMLVSPKERIGPSSLIPSATTNLKRPSPSCVIAR